jgi:hypothetical protein
LTGAAADRMMALSEIEPMRMKSLLLATLTAFGMAMLASAASAGWYGEYGNDTGGTIPWSPAISDIYRNIAADHCARYNKVAQITSVHPWYGDYVAFACAFPRNYDPVKAWYGVPAPY